MKNSIGHKYQKMTLAKLSKKMEVIRGIYVVSNWSLSTRQLLGLSWSPGGSGAQENFLLLSAYLWAPAFLFSLTDDHPFLLCRTGLSSSSL